MIDGEEHTPEHSWLDHFKVSYRDRALFLTDERDFDAQLIAIRGALRRHQEAEQLVSDRIKELDDYIRSQNGGDDEYQAHLEGQWVDTILGSVYQDAAHSMAAVGMLAPFIESLFVSVFDGLRRQQQKDEKTGDPNARRSRSEAEYWDPHFVLSKGGREKDIVSGIAQLSDAIGLFPYFPSDIKTVLKAIFEYRNKMFHHGFEWPLEERQKFEKRIRDAGWPDGWFKMSRTGGDPWIFYMSDEFIDRCLVLIDEVLDGVGKYMSDLEETGSS